MGYGIREVVEIIMYDKSSGKALLRFTPGTLQTIKNFSKVGKENE